MYRFGPLILWQGQVISTTLRDILIAQAKRKVEITTRDTKNTRAS